jgi:hypothetical protein
MKRAVLTLCLLATLLFTVGIPAARGINRYTQSIDNTVTFTWSSSFQLPKGQLPTTLTFPLRVAASGLPNKVTPNERFHIPVSVSLSTGVRLLVGDYPIDLDQAMQFALSYIPEEIDLRPFVTAFTCAIARVALEGLDADVICRTVGSVIRYIRLSLLNELVVTGEVAGHAEVQNALLKTWLGRSATFILDVSSFAQRGEQLVLSLVSKWSVSLYLDFQQDIYNQPIIGALFKKIGDALHLPWRPSLGVAHSDSIPSLASIVLIPDFKLESSRQDVTLTQGESTYVDIRSAPIDEFEDIVSLVLSNPVPQDIQASLSNPQITPPSSTVLQLSASNSAPAGDRRISIAASGGGKSHTLSITVHVKEKASPSVSTSQTIGGQTPILYGGLAAAFLLTLAIAGVAVGRASKKQSLVARPSSLPRRVRFCRSCGTQVRVGSRYCRRCGCDLRQF